MPGVCRSGPKFLAVFPSLDAGRFSVRTEMPGDIYQFGREVSVGHNQNSWKYLPVKERGVFRSEPKLLAIFTNLHARCSSVRTKTPGDISQCECEVSVSQNQNSWRYFPVGIRGVCRSGPKFLAIFPSVNAGRFSVRTRTPGDISQFEG